MMQTTELSPTKSLLHDAAQLLALGQPVPAPALRVIGEWISSWVDEVPPRDFTYATRTARAILGPEGRR